MKTIQDSTQWKTMNNINLTIAWIFGLLFLIIGIDAYSESVLGGISFILISFLLLPPIRSLTFALFKKKIPTWIRSLAILLLIVTFGFYMTQSKQKESYERALQLEKLRNTQISSQQKLEYFKQNTSTILEDVKRNYQNGMYEKVVSISAQYPMSENKELIKFYDKASAKLEKLQTHEEKTSIHASVPKVGSSSETFLQSSEITENQKPVVKTKLDNKSKSKEILARLKKIPVSQYFKNRDEYQKLVDLNPDNLKYKEKLIFYTNKINGTDKALPKENDEKITINDELNSASKSKSILAELKGIPASEYKLNKKLYQELVELNPDIEKYKKKLDYYSKKITEIKTQHSGNNTTSLCVDILNKKQFINSSEWVLTNGHCLSRTQKKTMENKLLARVKKLSSSKLKENRDGYKALSILNPGNYSYLKKLKKYENKLRLTDNKRLIVN